MEKDKKTIGIHEAYANDMEKADLDVFDREVDKTTRRGFLKKSALLTMMGIVGSNIPFAQNMPGGLIPAALANSNEPFSIKGKSGIVYLNDRPVNGETLPQYLDSEFTKPEHFFIRNNGIPPKEEEIDPNKWTLKIEGESCINPKTYTISELKKKFKHYEYALVIECGGNTRAEVVPATKGNQWQLGAVGCGRFKGVRLKDVLEDCGIKKDAVYIGYYGADVRLNGDTTKETISRGVPISKALAPETLIAWEYEGGEIPYMNGYPLRLVCGGWAASTSGKWLTKIVIRNKVHDGVKMEGQSYRVPKHPVAPGTVVPDSDMEVMGPMIVKSIITHPVSGITSQLSKKIQVRGKAWAGENSVSSVEVSIDFGATWQKAKLKKPRNRLSWQEFSAEVSFPEIGYYEIWAKATDSEGKSQPMVVPNWNPRGYYNNACHRIAVQIV